MKQTDSAFEQWYNGMVGFHINSERIIDDLNTQLVKYNTIDPIKLRKWMVVCWNSAIEAAQNEDAVAWDETIYNTLEDLKEKS